MNEEKRRRTGRAMAKTDDAEAWERGKETIRFL